VRLRTSVLHAALAPPGPLLLPRAAASNLPKSLLGDAAMMMSPFFSSDEQLALDCLPPLRQWSDASPRPTTGLHGFRGRIGAT
jgi:hypothetical protein